MGEHRIPDLQTLERRLAAVRPLPVWDDHRFRLAVLELLDEVRVQTLRPADVVLYTEYILHAFVQAYQPAAPSGEET